MSEPAPTNLTDRMIARLEEANTRSYKQLKRADEISSRPEQDAFPHPSDQGAALKRRPSRPKFWLFGVAGLVLATSVYITAFIWEPSYVDAAKLIIARWASLEVEQRFQKMSDELADTQRQVEQLKFSQDQIIQKDTEVAGQLKATQEQTARDIARALGQLDTVLAQMARYKEAVDTQLKAIQQLAETALSRPSPGKPLGRKRGSSQQARVHR
jgi:hypothetical protein